MKSLWEQKQKALWEHLNKQGLTDSIAVIEAGYDNNHFECQGEEYLVLTEDEREEAVKEYIKESIWAFNADFILDNSRIEWNNNREYDQIEKALKEMQEKLCESANSLILALIEDFDQFVDNAVSADGYGHFLSQYDGEEYEEKINDTWFYIYRTN